MEIPKFEFKKFKPSPDIIRKAEATLLQMEDFTPTHSVVFACLSKIKKLKNKYRCLIEVIGPNIHFSQAILSHDPRVAIDRVAEKIKEKLLNWKIENLVIKEPSFWNFKEVK